MKSFLDMLLPGGGGPNRRTQNGGLKSGIVPNSPDAVPIGNQENQLNMQTGVPPWLQQQNDYNTQLGQGIAAMESRLREMQNELINLMDRSKGGRIPAINVQIQMLQARMAMLQADLEKKRMEQAGSIANQWGFGGRNGERSSGPYSTSGVGPPMMGTHSGRNR